MPAARSRRKTAAGGGERTVAVRGERTVAVRGKGGVFTKITLVGMGPGNPALLTGEARDAIAQSDCLIGSARLLEPFLADKNCLESVSPVEIAALLAKQLPKTRAAVLVSGDVGFYSLANALRRVLENHELETICGIGSLQYFCARLNMAWDDVKVISLHGRTQDLIGAVRTNEKTFVLTGGQQGVSEICRTLCENGLSHLLVQVGERLSYPDERITRGSPDILSRQSFDPLAVLIIRNGALRGREQPVTHGLSDGRFLRGDVPMTKEEVRAVSIAKLRLRRGQTVWDVGAGTGSVAVEVARVLSDGAVYAVEKEPDALALLEQNRMRFNADSLRIVAGRAPTALEPLPAPDAVFIGGSGGALPQIIAAALAKNPTVRVVINAITLETVGAALGCLNEHDLCDKEVVQVSVARSKIVGGNNMMLGQNPVYIISAGGGKPTNA